MGFSVIKVTFYSTPYIATIFVVYTTLMLHLMWQITLHGVRSSVSIRQTEELLKQTEI